MLALKHGGNAPTEAVYFSAVEIEPNVPFKLVPTPLTTEIIATEMPAAISPYSMAVAPDSSLRKALSFRRIVVQPCVRDAPAPLCQTALNVSDTTSVRILSRRREDARSTTTRDGPPEAEFQGAVTQLAPRTGIALGPLRRGHQNNVSAAPSVPTAAPLKDEAANRGGHSAAPSGYRD